MQNDIPPTIENAGDNDYPGKAPPEVQPGEGGDTDNPGRPRPNNNPARAITTSQAKPPPKSPRSRSCRARPHRLTDCILPRGG